MQDCTNQYGAVLSAAVGTNADIFPKVLQIYAAPKARIFDATYGKGVFWSRVDRSAYEVTTNDLFQRAADLHVDFRNTKLTSSSYDMVVLDPPYAYSPKGTMKQSIAGCYGLNDSVDISNMRKVLDLYEAGIAEAKRLLKTSGILVLKTQDIIQSGKQWWMHTKMMQQPGFLCEDLFVLVQNTTPTADPNWKRQYHARKNHSFFVVLRKMKG